MRVRGYTRSPRTTDPGQYPRMLDATVRIDEFGSHGPDLQSLGMLEHCLQPPSRDHLRIVVEEKHVLTFGLGNACIVDLRIVERFSERYDPVRRRSQVLDRRRIGAIVVYDYDLVVGVGRQALNALEAILQQGNVIPGRDDEAHFRLAFDLRSHSKGVREKSVFYGAFDVSTLQRFGEGTMSTDSGTTSVAEC